MGLTNLGATCYMATCVQQLYMIPAARAVVLQNDGMGQHMADNFGKHCFWGHFVDFLISFWDISWIF